MSDTPFNDEPGERAVMLRRADDSLTECAERMKQHYHLDRSCAEIIAEIKATMRLPVQPHGLTVFQTLYDREREKVFNDNAAKNNPKIREEFGYAIQDYVTVREGHAPASRRTRKLADNAWKQDSAADRRIRENQQRSQWQSPYKGRPEVYDRDVVQKFADTIVGASAQKKFSIGHHGDKTITAKTNDGGPMFCVLVASIQWAMIAAWQAAAPFGVAPPRVKPEGILTVLKRRR